MTLEPAELIAAAPQVDPTPQPPRGGPTADTIPSQHVDHPRPHCGTRMVIIETFREGATPRHRPPPAGAIPDQHLMTFRLRPDRETDVTYLVPVV